MQNIQIHLGKRKINAYLYPNRTAPEKKGPVVIFLPDLTGVVPVLKESADRLAGEGFHVIVPDLYSDMGGPRYCMRTFFTKAIRNNEALGNEALDEISTMVAEVKQMDFVDEERIGIVGQCLTGGYILHMALRPDIKAPVVFHHSFGLEGSGIPAEDAARVCQNIQGHFVKVDPFCPPSRVEKLLSQFGDKMEAHIYPDLPHGVPHFFRLTESGRLAWTNMVRFLKAQLLTKSPYE